MDFDDYESLPNSIQSTGVHMTAGAVAGIMEHCVMYPLDAVKTRMQSLTPSPEATYQSVRHGLFKMVTTEGISKTVRGLNAIVLGAGPAHAFYFAAYEKIKQRLSSTNSFQNHFANAAAGCGATLLHDAIMVPSDVIKQRMQVFNSPYKSCYDCACKLYCKEGVKVFYRSYTTQILMNMPFSAIHIVTYEFFSNLWNSRREYNPLVHIVSGGLAGGIAAGITTPLDMCKTLLNTQEPATLKRLNQTLITGIWNAAKAIYSTHGIPGFYKGLYARILFQAPGTAISWMVYESFKHILSSNNPECKNPLPSDPSNDNSPTSELCNKSSCSIHYKKIDGGTKSLKKFDSDNLYSL